MLLEDLLSSTILPLKISNILHFNGAAFHQVIFKGCFFFKKIIATRFLVATQIWAKIRSFYVTKILYMFTYE